MEKPHAPAIAQPHWPWCASILFVAAYFVARGLLKIPETAVWVRVVAALLPIPVFGAVLLGLNRLVRQLDELELRIQLEALAIAFPLVMMLLLTLGLLEIAVPLPSEDLSYRHVWAMLPVLYLVGLVIARSRYR